MRVGAVWLVPHGNVAYGAACVAGTGVVVEAACLVRCVCFVMTNVTVPRYCLCADIALTVQRVPILWSNAGPGLHRGWGLCCMSVLCCRHPRGLCIAAGHVLAWFLHA